MSRKYWESLSDDELLNTELTTDDPEALEGLVTEIPEGDDEPYVEFKYDLRKSGREKEFVCVHGHHQHLAGFVMRKGSARFLVGWICGENIYREKFEHLKADFDAAVNRRDMVRRRYEIEAAIGPFTAWLQQISNSGVFDKYERVRRQFQDHMTWIWENMKVLSYYDERVIKAKLPKTLFDAGVDPQAEFSKICSEFGAAALTLIGKADRGPFDVGPVKRRMEMLLDRLEAVFAQLQEVVDFFQPEVLEAVCRFANEHDNPKKRKYIPGLGSITLKRERDKLPLYVPKNYQVPGKANIETFRGVLTGLTLKLAA